MSLLEISLAIACFILYFNLVTQKGWALSFVWKYFRYRRLKYAKEFRELRRKKYRYISERIKFPANVEVSSFEDLPEKVKSNLWHFHYNNLESSFKAGIRRIEEERAKKIREAYRFHKLEDPLYACPLCMVPWWGSFWYWFFYFSGAHTLGLAYWIPSLIIAGGAILLYLSYKRQI